MSQIPEPLLKIYRDRLVATAQPGAGSHAHVQWMVGEVAKFQDVAKANRWLGFIQCYCWMAGLFSIDDMRQHVREHLVAESFTFEVMGIEHHREDYEKAALRPGEELSLRLDPKNPVDPSAIKVLKGELHLGYVPKEMTAAVMDLMRAYTGRLVVENAEPHLCAVTMKCMAK